jgi:hypothetical protein
MEDQKELSKTVVKVVQNLLMKKWVFTNKSKQMSAKLIWPTSPLPAKHPIDDQIWQGWKNQTIRFPIPDYPVLAVF